MTLSIQHCVILFIVMLTVIRENAFMLNVMAPSIKLHLDWRYFVTKTPMAVAVAVLALHDETLNPIG
jgi:hypothetical protein